MRVVILPADSIDSKERGNIAKTNPHPGLRQYLRPVRLGLSRVLSVKEWRLPRFPVSQRGAGSLKEHAVLVLWPTALVCARGYQRPLMPRDFRRYRLRSLCKPTTTVRIYQYQKAAS